MGMANATKHRGKQLVAARPVGNLIHVIPLTDFCELHFSCTREVQVFGKTIVSEVTAFERGAAFEDEEVAEPTLAQLGQELGKAIVPLQNGLGDTPSSMLLVQPVSEKRDVAVRDHVCGMASSSSIPMLSWRCQRDWNEPDFGSVGSSRS
jgi:hypothetical protein